MSFWEFLVALFHKHEWSNWQYQPAYGGGDEPYSTRHCFICGKEEQRDE